MDQDSADGSSRRNEFVASFARGLMVLRAFGPRHQAMTLAEVAARSGQSRASARRFLLTLRELGYVCLDGDRFRLTPRVAELSPAHVGTMRLGDLCQPVIQPVAMRLGESASVGVLLGTGVEILAYARAPRQMSLHLAPGDRLPLFTSAQGRALLTGLAEAEVARLFRAAGGVAPSSPRTLTRLEDILAAVRRARTTGHVIVDEELEVGVRSIAMPIRDRDGRVVAAMSTCAHANRASADELAETFRPVLSRAIADIEGMLSDGVPEPAVAGGGGAA